MSARFHGHSQGLLGTAHAHRPSTGPSGLCTPAGCIYTLTNTLMMLWLADGPGSDFRKERIWTGCGRTELLNDKNISIKNTNYGRNKHNAHLRSFVRGEKVPQSHPKCLRKEMLTSPRDLNYKKQVRPWIWE